MKLPVPVPVKTVLVTRAYSTSMLNAIVIELASDAPSNIMTNLKDSADDILSGSLMHPDFRVVSHIDGLVFWVAFSYMFIYLYFQNKYTKKGYGHEYTGSIVYIRSVEYLYKFIEYNQINRQTKIVVFMVFYIFFKNVSHCT